MPLYGGAIMITSISKPKIPSSYSYVLKTSQLEEVLIENNIKTEATLVYWKPKIIGSIFEANFWLPNDRIPFNRLYIRAGVVLKSDILKAREGLVNEVFPKFIEWIKNIEKLERTSPLRTERNFDAHFQNNKVNIIKN